MSKLLSVILLGLLVAAPVGAQTATPTNTPTNTLTNTPTRTLTFTATRTLPPTKTITVTRTPTAASTATGVFTSTQTFTPTITRTVTPTVPQSLVPEGNAGCLVLSATPQAVGTNTYRMSFAYWAVGGPMWCGYDAGLSKTPGPHSGAMYVQTQGLVKCANQDLALYCIGDGSTVCWDETLQSTMTVTATPTVTPTPA